MSSSVALIGYLVCAVVWTTYIIDVPWPKKIGWLAMIAVGRNDHSLFMGRWSMASKVWPWLEEKPFGSKNDYGWHIINNFSRVINKKITLDELVDWIRSVEPKEETIETHNLELEVVNVYE